jgi:hypothetical protein
MMRRVFPLWVLWLMLGSAGTAAAAPAWGGNCLSCHGSWQTNTLFVIGEDTTANPDESQTGAPDRGTLKVFQAFRGQTKSLQVQLVGLTSEDLYAVELKRLRFAGVEHGGHLSYAGDCNWPEWGEPAGYYSDPAISYRWGPGPTTFTFDIEIATDASRDYYDLVFAVAGKFQNGGALFYAEEHFYLRVSIAGDLDEDGSVDLADYTAFSQCLAGPGQTTPPPGCPPQNFQVADLDADHDVDLADFRTFAANFSG